MTLVPEYKTCPKCHRKYSWNPDVGKMFCPHCGRLGNSGSGKSILDAVLDRKAEKRNKEEK